MNRLATIRRPAAADWVRGGSAVDVDEVTERFRPARYGCLRLGSGQGALDALANRLGDAVAAEIPEVDGRVLHAAW